MTLKSHIPYKRVLLKLTGERLGGINGQGIDFKAIDDVTRKILLIRKDLKTEFAIVVGAGNLFRGRQARGTNVDRASADYIGMLGTVMNALALREALERITWNDIRVMSTLLMPSVTEPFIRRKALYHLKKTGFIILAGGTGNPFFTTDSAAALRACELKCDVILKGSTVDGIYNKDPRVHSDAIRYTRLKYQDALERGLNIMDKTAFALCQTEKIPVIVFDAHDIRIVKDILTGKEIGTLVTE